MRTFPSAFTAAIAKNSGTPIWILSLTAAGVTHYLSDQGREIATWNGGVTLRPWVRSWGQVTESIGAGLSEIRVGDFSAEFRIDPTAAPNMETIALADDLEGSAATLSLWFAGLDPSTDPPQALWSGFVTDVEIPDDATVSMSFEDASNRLRGNAGTVVTTESQTVVTTPTGLSATLSAELPAGVNYTVVYLVSITGIVVGDYLKIGNEIVVIDGLASPPSLGYVSCDRAQFGTNADYHASGVTASIVTVDISGTAGYPSADPDDVGKIIPLAYGVVKKMPPVATEAGRLTTLTAELSDTATSAVVLDVTGLEVNDYCDINLETVKITAIHTATLTLTITRAQLGTVAALHLEGANVRQQKSLYKLIAHDGPLTSIDRVMLRVGTDIDITSLVTKYTGATGDVYTAAGYTGKAVLTMTPDQVASIRALVDSLALLDPTHGHGASVTSKAIRPDFLTVISGMWYGQSVPVNPETDSYNAVDGRPTTHVNADTSGVTCDFSYSLPTGSTGTPKRVRIAAQAPDVSVTGRTATISLRSGSSELLSASLPDNSLAYSNWYTLPTQTWAAVEAYKIRYVGGGSGQYSILADIWMEVEFDPSVGNSSTGITVNSALDSALGGQILVDVTATQSTMLDVINDLLDRAGASDSCTLSGTFPAGYAINGAILKPRPIIEIINQIAFECRAWFRFVAGEPTLIVRPDTLTNARTLTACAVDENHMRRYSRKKTPLDDILNTITLRYGRDYTMDGDDAYTLTSSTVDADSVETYGTKQQDDLFRFDFVTTATMADSVRDFYIARYATRCLEHRFSVFLDQLALEFSDAITLAFARGEIGEVLESRLTPGQDAAIDTIEIVIVTPLDV